MNRKDQGGFDAAIAVLIMAFVATLLGVVLVGLISVLGRSVGWW